MPKRAAPWIAAVVFVAACVAVARLQPSLARTAHKATSRDDVVALPPPEQMKVLDLGYDAATVDLLWSQVLVQYGIHWHEKRVFNALPAYLDALLAIEPDYAPLYRYVDTLIVYRYPVGTEDDARLARKYLERGIKARAGDHKVWMQYGQFIAFIAPSFLKSEDEIKVWKREGAEAMAHAVELGADADRSLSAATLLSKNGQTESAVRFLSRAYAITDDPQERENIAQKLAQFRAAYQREHTARAVAAVESRWKAELPFLSRGEFLLVGPGVDPSRCVGPAASFECARDWGAVLPADDGDER